MSITENIDLKQLNDGTIESFPRSINYHLLPFSYNSFDYKNVEIPKNIHFIWIGNMIKEKYIHTVINCKSINHDYNVILWVDDTSINQNVLNRLKESHVMVRHIYKELDTNKYDKLLNNKMIKLLHCNNNYGYKADIIRLYIVYMYGGIYSDIDSIWIKKLDDNFIYDFVTYRIDKQCSNITNSFFGFNTHSEILKIAMDNLELSVDCFLKVNVHIFKKYIPVISGPNFLTMIIKNLNLNDLNYIHQGYCVIGGPHEELYSYFSKENKSYCYQTFDKNWC